MVVGAPPLAVFDGGALIRALDDRRAAERLGWSTLADVLHEQSAELNDRLRDHAMCSGALVRTARRQTMSCQYALTLLRWLGRPPEDFLTGPVAEVGETRLPEPGPGHRLRWDLPELHGTLDRRRREVGWTWPALAERLDCTPSRLTNLRQARLADMGLVMRATQWLAMPAARFVHPADW